MLDNFRRRDVTRPPAARPESRYAELREALTPATPAAHEESKDTVRPEAQKVPAKSEVPNTDGDVVCKLIVGPEIKLKGAEITDCDTLVVQGRVEASMNSRVIQIAECGVFAGKVGIEMAEIRGRFEGELTVSKQLIIRSTGHVSGKIRYGKIAIEEGGEISGDVAAIAAAVDSSLNVRKNAAATEATSTLQAVATGLGTNQRSSGASH